MAGEGLSYAAAGVDIEAYERALERVKPLIAATHGEEVARGVGPFAGLFALPGGGHLAASADGVGTITIQAADWQEQADDPTLAGSARWPKEVDGLLHEATHPSGKPPLSPAVADGR